VADGPSAKVLFFAMICASFLQNALALQSFSQGFLKQEKWEMA
jgi:hypothetical protein